METTLEKILEFATKAHEGQKRKYTDEPYINHPIAVAKMVEELYGGQDLQAAALLHDVVEDTDVTFETLRAFLYQVCDSRISAGHIFDLVVELTDVYTKENFPSMNRAERKRNEAERLRWASLEAKQIKLADIEHNSETIELYDVDFAKVFLKEKEYLLQYI